jgi:hypothetical protein
MASRPLTDKCWTGYRAVSAATETASVGSAAPGDQRRTSISSRATSSRAKAAALDSARGEQPRVDFIRQAIEREIKRRKTKSVGKPKRE